MMKKTIYILLTISFMTFIFIKVKENYDEKKIINEMYAIRLTDTTCHKMSKTLREITIEYLLKNNLKPDEYFILKDCKLQYYDLVGPKENFYHNVYTLNLLRIGALKDLSKKEIHAEGAAGEEGDDINIVYDKNFKNVLGILSSE